ncbi:Chaperone protein dnaJ 8, chloroplastic-like protein [Drosera capensis]
MAIAVGTMMIAVAGSSSGGGRIRSSSASSISSWMKQSRIWPTVPSKKKCGRVRVGPVRAYGRGVATDPYATLRIDRRASESEVKRAFRRLALKYHPDVCKEDNCDVSFQQINKAYDTVMSRLRGEYSTNDYESQFEDEPSWQKNHPEWDLWEEWMGWEGAGCRDYSSHVNPYI